MQNVGHLNKNNEIHFVTNFSGEKNQVCRLNSITTFLITYLSIITFLNCIHKPFPVINKSDKVVNLWSNKKEAHLTLLVQKWKVSKEYLLTWINELFFNNSELQCSSDKIVFNPLKVFLILVTNLTDFQRNSSDDDITVLFSFFVKSTHFLAPLTKLMFCFAEFTSTIDSAPCQLLLLLLAPLSAALGLGHETRTLLLSKKTQIGRRAKNVGRVTFWWSFCAS